MAQIPPFVVEYFLLGKTREGAHERFTQDGGISTDVWLAFAEDTERPRRLLVAPSEGVPTIDLAFVLHRAIAADRADWGRLTRNRRKQAPAPSNVSPLEEFCAATLYFDEIVNIALPLTTWWRRRSLSALQQSALNPKFQADKILERAILARLGLGEEKAEVDLRKEVCGGDDVAAYRILDAAPLAALIGVFYLALAEPDVFADLFQGGDPDMSDDRRFAQWTRDHAPAIAMHACSMLSRQYDSAIIELGEQVGTRSAMLPGGPHAVPPVMIQRLFLDRTATLARSDALCTIKADAASRVFDVSCRNLNWAIIDSGIAAEHPAFVDHSSAASASTGSAGGAGNGRPPHRVRGAFDFTQVERIRSFDLTLQPEGKKRTRELRKLAEDLASESGRSPDDPWRARAVAGLELIARQLDQRLSPDWATIESLIRIDDSRYSAALLSDHGTHVAGILAADWRKSTPGGRGALDSVLRGVCPDIGLYDLRVLHPTSRRSTESALLAALEFVQHVNARAGSNGPVIHGVNVSLSIPHDVRNYGCGATPVCVSCNRLAASGVVVVAAAGNRGWNEGESDFGNFVYCSITDPGNAEGVITVGSTHRLRPHSYGVSYFSSRGPTGDGRSKPDLVAPGEQIRGPVRGDGEDELDGTSMAAPFVSGAAAMLMARHRELVGQSAKVKEILCRSATDLGREKYFQGHGLVDVLRALQSV